jgi:hypothetical protein
MRQERTGRTRGLYLTGAAFRLYNVFDSLWPRQVSLSFGGT